jgi:hypothetical protein
MPSPEPIRYSDIVCLISGHDAEWSRRKESHDSSLDDVFGRVFAEIKSICEGFRNGMNEYAGTAYRREETQENLLAPQYLFNPLCYLPIGHPVAHG